MIIALVVVWFVCAAISYAAFFGYLQGEYPLIAKDHYRFQLVASLVVALGGPMSLVADLVGGYFKHGLKWR